VMIAFDMGIRVMNHLVWAVVFSGIWRFTCTSYLLLFFHLWRAALGFML
jgi:hypothetical protein